MPSSKVGRPRRAPTGRRILAARCAQLLTLFAVLVGLYLSVLATALGALLAWERLVQGVGGDGPGRWVAGVVGVLICLGGVAALAATLWLAWEGVGLVGARVAGAPLARMTGGHHGGFFELASPWLRYTTFRTVDLSPPRRRRRRGHAVDPLNLVVRPSHDPHDPSSGRQ